MAKRKRLTPVAPSPPGGEAGLETKSMFAGPERRAAPIADVAAGAAARAALEELSDRWEAARRDGKLVLDLPLDQIEMNHLVRDRTAEDPEETQALRDSLRLRGQQTPIEVVALPGRDGYGLLSGWRRCQALRGLHAETGDPRFGTVLALLRQPEDGQAAYLAMIEENEIRANLSHYERARIVVKAAEQGLFATEKEALSALFASVPRARRSKIGSFISIVKALDAALRFPEALSERVGLELAQQLREQPQLGQKIAAALQTEAPATPAAERALITHHIHRVSRTEAAPQDKRPVQATEKKKNSDILAQWPDLTLRRNGAKLELTGPAADAELGADLAAWLSARREE